MLSVTIQAVAEPKPNTGVALWRMKPTNFFVRSFCAPGSFGHGKAWEEEWGKLKKVFIFSLFLIENVHYITGS